QSPKTSKMEPPFDAEFVRGVQGFIEADSLPGSHMIHRKRHRLIVDRRGADVPVHVIRLRRPVSGDLIFRTRAERPSSGLGERNVGKAIDREGWRGRGRGNVSAAQFRAAGLLPTVEQAIEFKV